MILLINEGGQWDNQRYKSLFPCITGTSELEPNCGRPLGMRFDRYGINLIVADAYFGLLEVNTRARTVNTLVPPLPVAISIC